MKVYALQIQMWNDTIKAIYSKIESVQTGNYGLLVDGLNELPYIVLCHRKSVDEIKQYVSDREKEPVDWLQESLYRWHSETKEIPQDKFLDRVYFNPYTHYRFIIRRYDIDD